MTDIRMILVCAAALTLLGGGVFAWIWNAGASHVEHQVAVAQDHANTHQVHANQTTADASNAATGSVAERQVQIARREADAGNAVGSRRHHAPSEVASAASGAAAAETLLDDDYARLVLCHLERVRRPDAPDCADGQSGDLAIADIADPLSAGTIPAPAIPCASSSDASTAGLGGTLSQSASEMTVGQLAVIAIKAEGRAECERARADGLVSVVDAFTVAQSQDERSRP